MTHVRVERLGAGDGKQDRTEDNKRSKAVAGDEVQRIARIESLQDRRRFGDVPDTVDAQRHEPQGAYRPEEQAHDAGPIVLDREERNENARRDRHDIRLQRSGTDLQPLDRREHRNRRSEHRVAVKEGRAENANQK